MIYKTDTRFTDLRILFDRHIDEKAWEWLDVPLTEYDVMANDRVRRVLNGVYPKKFFGKRPEKQVKLVVQTLNAFRVLFEQRPVVEPTGAMREVADNVFHFLMKADSGVVFLGLRNCYGPESRNHRGLRKQFGTFLQFAARNWIELYVKIRAKHCQKMEPYRPYH